MSSTTDSSVADVVWLADRIHSDQSLRSERDTILDFARSLGIPQPAWYAGSVLSKLLKLLEREFFSHGLERTALSHYEPELERGWLVALEDMLYALRSNPEAAERSHLGVAPKNRKNPFHGKCLSTAPIWSSIGLSTSFNKSGYDRVLAEAVASSMAYCHREQSLEEYLKNLGQPSDVPRLGAADSRFERAGFALRYFSENERTDLLNALVEGVPIGSLVARFSKPTKQLDFILSNLEVRGQDCFRLLHLYFELTVKNADLRKFNKTKGTSSGGGSSQAGHYVWTSEYISTLGLRDFADDHPDYPTSLMVLHDPEAVSEIEDAAPTETATPDQIAFIERDDDTDLSLEAQILAARHKAQLIERSNQVLPFSWGHSTDAEISIYRSIASNYSTDDLAHRCASMYTSAALATGCTPGEFQEVRWTRSSFSWHSAIEFDIDRCEWRIPSISPAFKTTRSTIPIEAEVQIQQYVVLPDYLGFAEFFVGEKDALKRRQKVVPLLEHEVSAALKNRFALMPIGQRLSAKRCANVLPLALYAIDQDVGPLSTIINDSSWHSATVAHYQATSRKNIKHAYRQAMLKIAPKQVSKWDVISRLDSSESTNEEPDTCFSEHDNYVGSKRLPRISFLTEKIRTMQLSLAEHGANGVSARVEFHNAFQQYVAAWLAAELAMRAIKDPAPLVADLIDPVAFLSDKQRGTRYLDRVSGHTPLLAGQLKEHTCHNQAVTRLIQANGGATPQSTFYLIEPNGKNRPLAPSDFGKSGFHLPYSVNVFRRLLRTYLSENGVNGEIIDAFLGHGRRGTERWNKFSTLSANRVREIIGPYIGQLSLELGWRVITSPFAR